MSLPELTTVPPLFPQQWIDRHSPTSLWIEVHRVPYLPDPYTPDPPRCVDLGDVCATFVRSVLHYQSARAPAVDLATQETWADVMKHPPQMQIPIFMEDWIPKVDSDPASLEQIGVELPPPGVNILVLHNLQIVNHKTTLGTFVVLATPHSRSGMPGNEALSKERLRTAAGLLGAVMGRNAVYERLFDSEIDGMGRATNVRSPTVENPSVFRQPNLSDSGLAVVEAAAARISSLPADIHHRTKLQLRWLYEAMLEINGVFAFLKYWIAIETMAMPNGTDIRPAIRQLAAAYNMSELEARDFFALGRLFSLRGDIVHRGLTPRMDQYLLAYIEGVYVDLLAQTLDVDSRIAQATLERHSQTAVELIARARL